MRIAHIESSMDWGGQELRILEQTAWLNANGHVCWIIARPGSEILRRAREQGQPVFELEIRGSVNPGTFWRLARFLARERIALLDCHGNRDASYGAYLKWLGRVAVIRSRHVTDPIRAGFLSRLVWQRGHHGVVVTAGRIREMLAEAGLVPPDLVTVAVAGVDEHRFSPDVDRTVLRDRLGIPRDAVVVANVGMIRPDKGQLYFVRAMRQLQQSYPDLVAIQLGEATGQTGAYKAQVLEEAGPALADGRIRFLGYQSDIENWIALADMVVVASIGTEAQTRLVAQAFLMKKNVVATTVGGLPEMIRHGETGLLCAPASPEAIADAIGSLLADPDKAVMLRENAFTHASRFMSFAYMMQGMLACYEAALRRAGRSA